MTNDDAVRRDAHRVILGAFDGTSVPPWLSDLFAQGLGGICLYGSNLGDSPGTVTALARDIAALAPTGVIAIDEEGGDVTRLHSLAGSPYPGNAVLGQYDDLSTTQAVARAIAAELKACGIWLNLAPCADVNSNPLNPVIGTRSFGADPDLVARHTRAYVEGMQELGVAACVKHFPGHGDTDADSHTDLPHVRADLDVVLRRDIAPFEAASEAAAIMTSHIVVDAIDPDHPATLSHRILTGLLRDSIGYDGLIVSDALDMAGASAEIGIPAAAVRSLAAGADLLCIGPAHGQDGSRDVRQVVGAITTAVAHGELPAERLADAARRVDDAAGSWATGVHAPAATVIEDGRRLGAEAVAALLPASLDLRAGRPLVIKVERDSNPAVGKTAWGDLGLTDADAMTTADGLLDIASVTDHSGPVLVVARRAASDPARWGWLLQIVGARPDVVLLELGWPAPDLHDVPRVVYGWGAAKVVADQFGALLTRSRR